MSLSCTYILALSIGMFHYLELVFLSYETHILLDLYYKELLFFFKIFKISEKVQKINKKTKNIDNKRCYLWHPLSHVSFEKSTVYHIRWLGISLTLGVVLVTLILSSPIG